MKKFFYEKSGIESWPTNITYGELVSYDKDKLYNWLEELRGLVLKAWDENGTPPVVGKDENGIKSSFSKLRQYDCSKFFYNVDSKNGNDPDIIGVVANFTKFGSAANQFFPTMLKTKIASGGSEDSARSIYDYFTDKWKDSFHQTLRRVIFNDSMYIFSKSISLKVELNPYFKEGETAKDLFIAYKNGDGRFDDKGLRISKISCSHDEYNRSYRECLTIKADEIREWHSEGLIDHVMLSYLDDVNSLVDTFYVKNDKEEPRINVYIVRVYEKNVRVFPGALQAFRISFSQPAVNFPPLTAKFLYEHFTKHIPANQMVTVYDPSAGWGGRILGAMSLIRPIHYVGTDPNTDNLINELGISRYEYLADFYLKSIGEIGSNCSKFFDTKETHTYELFQDGSETIQFNPKFKKYKDQLDFVFTSPPYFNREMYSDDETQSYKAHSSYSDWRDNFLRPTLETAVSYLKNDRYLCWNIANIRISDNKTIQLEEDSVSILKSLGMEYKGKICMLMSKMIGNTDPQRLANKVFHKGEWWKMEPIFVFYKP
jgi:hypothetical protein